MNFQYQINNKIEVKDGNCEINFLVTIKDLSSMFCCPDDRADLDLHNDLFVCNLCKRKFLVKDNIVDFRPKEKFLIEEDGNNEHYYESYYDQLATSGNAGRVGTFGLVAKSIPVGFVNETISHLRNNIQCNQVVCDIGSGSGDYSIKLAKRCKIIFHCDLDMNGILLAQEKARKGGITNIFFIRCDYFKLPFKQNTVDLVYLIDVIYFGIKHDKFLLTEVIRILKMGSYLLFDCHSKERSKLTRISSKSVSTYSKAEILKLARELSIRVTNIVGTGFVPQLRKWSTIEYVILNNIAKVFFFPPARWMITCNVNTTHDNKIH